MNSIFQGEFNRLPDYSKPRDCALAISRWLSQKRPGGFIGGFFDGEESKNGAGQQVFGVICVGRNP
jgi:hypothetical protein